MRAVIQRVLSASVRVDGEVVGELDAPGLLVYLGVTHDDGEPEVGWTARKIWDLRLLRDEKSASDVAAPVLVVSQFTLYGDARKGRRPTWQAAAPVTMHLISPPRPSRHLLKMSLLASDNCRR